jgi:nucleotide-binding universal stress UspA family protein
VSGMRRVIVGVSGSAGSVRALRYAARLARDADAPLTAILAWVPPGGDLAERRAPSAELRRIWKQAAAKRLDDAMRTAWGSVPADLMVDPMVVRGPGDPARRPDASGWARHGEMVVPAP